MDDRSARLVSIASRMLVGAMACGLCACEGEPRASDCQFVNDPDNCWRTLVEEIRLCLGAPESQAAGQLSSDGKSCEQEGGRRVTFATPMNVMTKPAQLDAEVFASVYVSCARIEVEAETGRISVTGPDGRVLTAMPDEAVHGMSVTCQDGRMHRIAGDAVMRECFEEAMGGGAPAVQLGHDGITASAAFSGYDWKLYECR